MTATRMSQLRLSRVASCANVEATFLSLGCGMTAPMSQLRVGSGCSFSLCWFRHKRVVAGRGVRGFYAN